MGRKRKEKVKINYPPVPTRKWVPPDQRKKRRKTKPLAYPQQLTQKLTISSLLKVWHDYKIINDCAVLLGDISMFHHRFTFMSNGYQGHCICIVCALYSKMCPSYHWCSKTIDEIVVLGDRYYQRNRRLISVDPLIPIEDLNKNLFIHHHKITICLKNSKKFKSWLFKDLDSGSKDFLSNIIPDFFDCFDCGVLIIETTPKRYFTIWKFGRGYFLFDPADHDEMCWPIKKPLVGKGHPFVVRFSSTDRLVQVLQRQMPPTNIECTLLPIDIERIVFINTRYPACMEDCLLEMDPVMKDKLRKEAEAIPSGEKATKSVDEESKDSDVEEIAAKMLIEEEEEGRRGQSKKKAIKEKPHVESVTFFTQVVPDSVGILLAETHQEDPEFNNCYSLKDFCMSLGALVYLRESKSRYWTSRILTNALRLGFRICVESLMAIQPSRELKISDISKKIELNEKFYTPEIESYGAIGRLNSTDDAILDLLPALKEVFSENDTIILDGPLVVGLWKEDGVYYMYDPHERDSKGKAIVKDPIGVDGVDSKADSISGVACLTWFKDLADLVKIYMLNVDRLFRNDTFRIANVEVKDWVELAQDWFNFKALAKDQWILQGSCGQADYKFSRETRDTQCTANCAMAIAYAHLFKLEEWSRDTIDHILENGDIYYKECMSSLQKKGKLRSPMLMVSELLTEFPIVDKLASMEIDECLVNGVVTFQDDTDDKNAKNLQSGLAHFFADNDYGILMCRGTAVAIWRRGDSYYCFDSHDRDDEGFIKVHGKACVQRFLHTEPMANIIMANFGPDAKSAIYNITKIDVSLFDRIIFGAEPDEDDSEESSFTDGDVDVDDEDEPLINKMDVDRPLFDYTKITKKRAILRSRFAQSDEKEFDVNAGKQTVGNLLASVAFSRAFDPQKWSVDQLDDVLRQGDKIYKDSIEEVYKQRAKMGANILQGENEADFSKFLDDTITVKNVVDSFKIGVNKFSVEFNEIDGGLLENNGQRLLNMLKEVFRKEPEDLDDFKEMIVQTDNLDVIVWKRNNVYYLFDPRPRDDKGYVYGKEQWTPEQSKHILDKSEIKLRSEEVPPTEGETDAEDITNANELRDVLEKEMLQYSGDGEEGADYKMPKFPPEYWEDMANREGRACVLRFTKPKYLVKHILANTAPKLQPLIDYKLFRVRMRNVPEVKDRYEPEYGPKPDPLSGPWYNWQEITHGQWILRGTIHEKDVLFPETNRGLQSHANCVLALAYAHTYPLAQFKRTTVDDILKYGDRLYTCTRRMRRKQLEGLKELNLTPEEIDEFLSREVYTCETLFKKFCVNDENVLVTVNECVVAGEVNAQEVEDELDIYRGVKEFFSANEEANENGLFGPNKMGILTAKSYTVAIFHIGSFYYMFDANERGPHGFGFENGVSCITRFNTIDPLADLFLKNLPKSGKNFYCIHEVIITGITCRKGIRDELNRIEDPLKITGFEPLIPGKMILRGTMSVEHFAKGSIVQSIPIAFCALVMALLHRVEFWTALLIDEVVTCGDSIYTKYADRCDVIFNPWEDKMSLALCPKDFRIGKNKANCQLRSTDQSGILRDSKDVVPLGQGLEKFFEENCYGILEAEPLSAVAIWVESYLGEDHYYLFDPYARGKDGLPSIDEGSGGVACVLRFAGCRLMANHLVSLIMVNNLDVDVKFVITPVEIVIERDGRGKKSRKYSYFAKQKVVDTEKLKRLGRFTFYVVPGEEYAVLRGTKSENHKCFSLNSRGKQDVANCLIAYIVDKLIPLTRWTYKTIDMILDIGDQLYKDSYMLRYNNNLGHLKSGHFSEKVGLDTLIRDVVIKDLRVRISIGAPVLTARFNKQLLTEALVTCFNLKNFCIVLLDDWAVALFKKCDCEEVFYIFDPTDVDLDGRRTVVDEHEKRKRCGSAALIRFNSLNTLVDVLMRNMDARPIVNDVFHIIVAAVKQIERIKAENLKAVDQLADDPECDRIVFGRVKVCKKRKKGRGKCDLV